MPRTWTWGMTRSSSALKPSSKEAPMKKTSRFSVLLALILGLALPLRAEEILVFAAASLTDALKELGTAYEKESGDKAVFNFGSSSLLARQILEGASADLFASADEAQMDRAQRSGSVDQASRKV